MKNIIIENNNYKLEKNYKDCFSEEEVLNKFTDYFTEYDYIFGDYSYDSLRMKGFYNNNNNKATEINNIKNLENYIKNYCAYDAKYFLLKKIN